MPADAQRGGIGPFASGELALLIDRKKRRYLIRLAVGAEFHSHAGVLPHDALIGDPEGVEHRSTRGAAYLAVRPTLADFVLKMPRGAQVIYPKDLGAILMLADIRPGHRVLESGIGSGALSMTLLRAGALVTGYEIREDFAIKAADNVASYLGPAVSSAYVVAVRDVYDGIDETEFDRVVLDLPEPWHVVPHAVTALRPGGIILAYTPSVTQVMRFREAIEANGFGLAQTIEVMHRGWHVEGAAVRPDHRMVGHTGFLTTARLLTPLTDE